jgi:hypothetical protein
MAAALQEVRDSQEGYVGADFDRGVSRLSEKTVEAISSGALSPAEGLCGLLDLLKHRPEIARRMGKETDSRLAKDRQRSRERYHELKAQKTERRAELEELMQAA